jgi:hypothetical protein
LAQPAPETLGKSFCNLSLAVAPTAAVAAAVGIAVAVTAARPTRVRGGGGGGGGGRELLGKLTLARMPVPHSGGAVRLGRSAGGLLRCGDRGGYCNRAFAALAVAAK